MKPPLTDRQARAEAERCLQCFDAPCTAACPARIDIPAFIAMLRSGNARGAAEVVKSANALANVCGKVCPEDVFCQPACTRGRQDEPLMIRELHFHATQQEARHGYSTPRPFVQNGKTVAVVGGGPAGLACAFELAKLGYRVDLCDRTLPGGVPRNSIPSFRLSEREVRDDIDFLSRFIHVRQLSVDRERFDGLRKSHDALFVALGLTADRPLPIPGATLRGVIPVLTFMANAKASPPAPGERLLIVGGGNVSLDAAATAREAGWKEVLLLYRRGEDEMRVWRSELEEARKRRVQIQFLVNPVEIIGRDKVEAVRCRRTRLSGSLDASGRYVPVEIEGSDFTLDADAVIVAIGQVPAGDFLDLFERTPQGYLRVDETFCTSIPGIYAGGDLVGGEGTIVQSVGQGKAAAAGIHRHLSGGALS